MKKFRTRLIFIICYMAYTSIYIARLNLTMASTPLEDAGMLTTGQIGLMGSVFSVVYAISRLINGIISDKRPPYVMISFGLILAGVSNIAIGFFPPFVGILILWGANAFAQSMLWSSVITVVSSIYDIETAKRKTSFMSTSVCAGNVLGIILGALIINALGVRYAFILPGAVTLVLSVFVIIYTRKIKGLAEDKESHVPLFSLFSHPEIRLCILPAMFHGVLKDNISLWMAMYFMRAFNVDLAKSAAFSLFVPLLGFVGRMLYPVSYRLCGEQEQNVNVYAFGLCALLCIPLCFDMIPPVFAVICLSLIYAAISIINTTFLSIYPISFADTGNTASVSGIMDFATYLGAGISSLIYGKVIENAGFAPMYISWAVLCAASLLITVKLIKLIKKRKAAKI